MTVFPGRLLRKRYSVREALPFFRMISRVSESAQEMPVTRQCLIVALLTWLIAASWQNAMGQVSPAPVPVQAPGAVLVPSTSPEATGASSIVASPQLLLDFKDSDIKFDLRSMMEILRDSRHEGWVLAAYPDPKTSRPLIGAGFGLDVEATDHPQTDPLNPRPFIEPSTAQLWQTAGLDPELLQKILDRFDRDLEKWQKKKYRKKIRTHTLSPELTNDEAIQLLRISSVQAVQNARAYCRTFDQLTAYQQMALSQLVFQMGVNLEEFVQFLGALNGVPDESAMPSPIGGVETVSDHWKTVQHTLVDSEWARRYTTRAISVIAMFDPEYIDDPRAAERRVEAQLPPPVKHHHKKTHSAQSKRKVV